MPTRVILEETAPGSDRSKNKQPVTPPSNNSNPTPRTPSTSFRQALGKHNDDVYHSTLSSLDIRSSPRISYYLYSLLCCSVMLVSIVQFFFKHDDLAVPYRNEQHYVGNYGVYRWKLRGAFGMSSGGIVIYLAILLLHFDTICCPNVGAQVFHDGSKQERNLIFFLILFWAGVLFMCTSTLSVGSVQPNVYFTSWIGFGVNTVNYNVWRTCAGNKTWGEMLKNGRETTFNWTCTLFFAIVAACGASDSYVNRDEISIYVKGEAELYERDRQTGLILSWTSVAVAIVALLGNHYFYQPYSMTCCNCVKMTLDWRQFEGVALVFLLALYGYVLFVYTGTQGVFNSPSNTYFGIWGTFFSATITLSTWVKENRNFLMFRPARAPQAAASP